MTSKQQLIDGLNEALAYEYQAVQQYIHYAASVSGIHRGELKEEFQSEVRDELRHAQFLADKVDALGGTPTTEVKPFPAADNPREMLEAVREAEADAIDRYVDLMEQAEDVGDLGLANDLHDIISDETEHKEETEKLLRGHWKE
jgi:bacterioferritin